MINKLWITVTASLLLATNNALAGNVIDRIVATVNGHIILQSDWDDALSYEALIGGKSLEGLSADDRKTGLNRLIDQELLREQIGSSGPQYVASDEAIATRIRDIRKQYPGASTGQGWKQILTRYDLSEDEVKNHVASELTILRLVDDRLASSVQVDDKSVQDYYNESFLPQLRQTGAKDVPLSEVAPKIKELVAQQKLNQALSEWLQALREGSVIRMNIASSDKGDQPR
jgi:hypothetical protein